MLFNSIEYILLFLPITALLYFQLNKLRLTDAATTLLVVSSLFFYSWWNISYLPLLLFSILFNYTLGKIVSKKERFQKIALIIGISVNLLILGTFKYLDFFIDNLNAITNNNIALFNIVLPLAISFFTFQQIAYLVDSYRGLTKEYDFLRYTLFVTFFPQLIAGPIVHHKEMIPQFFHRRSKLIHYKNISHGIFIFTIGLFKKVVIADYFSTIATPGFDESIALNFFDAWATSLAYTFQLYFDFSGYTDMAIGSALLFNIRLPINFNSPYKATHSQEFWKRWHITWSRFLRDYVYIALGGNKNNKVYRNLMLTFLIGGLWHGAGWTFIFWGFLHGLATIIHRVWKKLNIGMPTWLAWFITFNFLNISWIFFRAQTWNDALKVLQGMLGINGIYLSEKLLRYGMFERLYEVDPAWFGTINSHRNAFLYLIIASFIVTKMKNSSEYVNAYKPSKVMTILITTVFIYLLFQLSTVSEFLYFNF